VITSRKKEGERYPLNNLLGEATLCHQERKDGRMHGVKKGRRVSVRIRNFILGGGYFCRGEPDFVWERGERGWQISPYSMIFPQLETCTTEKKRRRTCSISKNEGVKPWYLSRASFRRGRKEDWNSGCRKGGGRKKRGGKGAPLDSSPEMKGEVILFLVERASFIGREGEEGSSLRRKPLPLRGQTLPPAERGKELKRVLKRSVDRCGRRRRSEEGKEDQGALTMACAEKARRLVEEKGKVREAVE